VYIYIYIYEFCVRIVLLLLLYGSRVCEPSFFFFFKFFFAFTTPLRCSVFYCAGSRPGAKWHTTAIKYIILERIYVLRLVVVCDCSVQRPPSGLGASPYHINIMYRIHVPIYLHIYMLVYKFVYNITNNYIYYYYTHKYIHFAAVVVVPIRIIWLVYAIHDDAAVIMLSAARQRHL